MNIQELNVEKAIAAWDALEAGLHKRTVGYHKKPETEWVDPFRIFGELYYIGDKVVASHLLDTGNGLVLFDTCFPHTRELLVKRIEVLGFALKDVKYIIHTHEHFDHFGASRWFQTEYGCKTFMHEAGCETFRIHPHPTELQSSFSPDAALFIPDVEFVDGDVIELGNVRIECVHTPGHSAGASAFFFDLNEGERCVRAGLCGVNGNLPLHVGRLLKYGIPLSARDEYLTSIERMLDVGVDITLDTHPRPGGELVKREALLENPDGGNPFLDCGAWRLAHEDYQERFAGLVARENKELGLDE